MLSLAASKSLFLQYFIWLIFNPVIRSRRILFYLLCSMSLISLKMLSTRTEGKDILHFRSSVSRKDAGARLHWGRRQEAGGRTTLGDKARAW